jgi:hypothetical protein
MHLKTVFQIKDQFKVRSSLPMAVMECQRSQVIGSFILQFITILFSCCTVHRQRALWFKGRIKSMFVHPFRNVIYFSCRISNEKHKVRKRLNWKSVQTNFQIDAPERFLTVHCDHHPAWQLNLKTQNFYSISITYKISSVLRS